MTEYVPDDPWGPTYYLGGPLEGELAERRPGGTGHHWPTYRNAQGLPMRAVEADRAIIDNAGGHCGEPEFYIVQHTPHGRFYVWHAFLPAFQLAQRHHALAS